MIRDKTQAHTLHYTTLEKKKKKVCEIDKILYSKANEFVVP